MGVSVLSATRSGCLTTPSTAAVASTVLTSSMTMAPSSASHTDRLHHRSSRLPGASQQPIPTPDSVQFDGMRRSVSLGVRHVSHTEAFYASAQIQTSLPEHTHPRRSDKTVGPLRTPAASGRRGVVSAVFERFTERAIRAIMSAQKEAKAAGYREVSTEQLLMGLVAEDGGGFVASGITTERAREVVRALVADGLLVAPKGTDKPAAEIPFSVGSKRVFEAALEESRQLRHNFIAPEHLVVALLTVDGLDGALKVLDRMGVRKDKLRAEALAMLKGELANEGRSTATLSPSSAPSPAASSAAAKPPAMAGSSVGVSRNARGEKSALADFCVNLTARAMEGKIDPVIGRVKEVQRVMEILARRRKNNPVLLGEPGVGKTAIAEGLALRIAENRVPVFLQSKRVMALDMGLLLAGAKERGELETRVTNLIAETQKAGDVILVIDEVHTMVGSGSVGRGGSGGAGLDIANLLKPALARGTLQCIGATTLDEFRKHVEKDKALARRFQPVMVQEPAQGDAVAILMGLRSRYEEFHRCHITDDAILAAVRLSAQYIPDRQLPDKAIDLVDEAASRARIAGFRRRRQRESSVLHGSPDEYWREIRAVQASQDAVLAKEPSFTNPLAPFSSSPASPAAMESSSAAVSASVVLVEGLSGATLAPSSRSSYEDDGPIVVDEAEIAAVASMWSGVPLQQLTTDETQQLVALEGELQTQVIGQNDAVAAISRAVRRARVGLKDPRRPIAAMMFCGPTGVGKTELTRALARQYYGTEDALIRLDMSEYMERHSVSKLIGSPPGYVGYEDAGKLTEAVRRRPFSVVLFDEIEKAHPDFFNMLLQIFEDGRLTDSKGRVVSFKNTLIVMTSNVGSTVIARGGSSRIGFIMPGQDDADGGRYAALKETVMEELKGHFRPELLNRIDEVVVFRSLEKAQVRAIVDKLVGETVQRLLAERGVRLEISEAVIGRVCEEGYDRAYGARPLRRAVTRLVEDPLSEAVLADPRGYGAGDTALVDLDESGLVVVTKHGKPDVCEHGLCLPVVKVPASVAAGAGGYSLPD